jgi:O-antigen/teichoic acid export membrane protein
MLGNFSSVFMTSMDRWFVKYLLPTVDFAEYSFAVSMESMLSVAVTPFTVTMYNYFCRQKNDDNVRRMHNLILIVASVLVACAFPAKLVIQIWLVDYMNSVSVLFYLFGAQIFFIIIKSIYVNLYKARQMQKVYFVKLVLVLGAGICMNIILYLIMKEKEAMAIGTMVSAVFWFLLCQNDFKNIRYDWKHIVYMMIAVVSFILLGNNLGAIQGCVLYLAIVCIGCIVLLREDVTYLSQIIKRTFYGKSKSGQRSC